MRRYLAHGLAIAFLIVGLGAAQGPNISEAKAAPVSSTQTNPEALKQVGKTKPYQVGTASWYGQIFDGKPTASGEPYDMYDMTAAHLKLPMGSYVRVTNLRNGRAVVVRVMTAVRSFRVGLSTCRTVLPKRCNSSSVVCNACVWIWSTPATSSGEHTSEL